MKKTKPSLQQYADEHCNGDRFRAIYEIYQNGEKKRLEPYIDQMTKDESFFVLFILRKDLSSMYGGTENLGKTLLAEQVASFTDMSLEEIKQTDKNPYKKPLKKGLIILVLGMVISVASVFFKESVASTIAIAGSIVIGMGALTLANTIMGYFNFKKAKRMSEDLKPPKEVELTTQHTFEEQMEAFRKEHRVLPTPPPFQQ